MSVYLENFTSRENIEQEYACTLPPDAEILLAYYGYGSYCGSSFVVFRQNGKLYEVNASHCSCYGLSDQWDPEETTVAALRMRELGKYSYDGSKEAQDGLNALLDRLEAEGQT